VEVYDKCRTESAWRNYLGDFYPSSTVGGINAQGSGSSVSFTFAEGINENGNIYIDDGDNTATVQFCAQVGLYYSGTLINFAEVKMTYNVDLITNFASLAGYTVTGAEAFTDADDKSFNFDGTLYAYFCNPSSYEELGDDGAVIHQGSTLNLCFKVQEGNFEISDVKDLMIKNAIDAEPNQSIIYSSIIDTPTYAEKTCHDSSNYDTNVCVVSFLLKAEFYDYNQMTLTGEGNVILEFGGAEGPQRQRRYRQLNEKVGHVTVKAMEMMFSKQSESSELEKPKEEKDTGSTFSTPVAAAAGATLVALCVAITAASKSFARRKAVARKTQVLERLRRRNGSETDCSATHLSHDIVDMTMSMSLFRSDQRETSIKTSCKSKRVPGDEKRLIHCDSSASCLNDSDVLDWTSSIHSVLNVSDPTLIQSGVEKLHSSQSSIASGVSC
jgi:hypothetical protein